MGRPGVEISYRLKAILEMHENLSCPSLEIFSDGFIHLLQPSVKNPSGWTNRFGTSTVKQQEDFRDLPMPIRAANKYIHITLSEGVGKPMIQSG